MAVQTHQWILSKGKLTIDLGRNKSLLHDARQYLSSLDRGIVAEMQEFGCELLT